MARPASTSSSQSSGPTIHSVCAGDKKAVAETFNLIEDRRLHKAAEAARYLDEFFGHSVNRAHVVGITGPPGAGKSCLISAMITRLRDAGKSVGVIAVDPSSRASRGALLGDRVRMEYDASDSGVFVRSMANRGQLGGVSDRTYAGTIVLRAAYDVVLVETVGVGQAEADVADMVDTTVFVIQPGSGDSLQFMKAGIMEEPHVLVVNKADQPQAGRSLNDVTSALATALREDAGWHANALLCSATKGTGIEAFLAELDRHRAYLLEKALFAERRRKQAGLYVERAIAQLYGSRGLESLGGAEIVEREVLASEPLQPFSAVQEFASRIESATS